MNNKIEVTSGDTYGRLTIIKEVEKHVYPSGETRRKFLAQCSCGSEPKQYLFNQLTSGQTRSCGCLNKERVTKHGMNDTRVYQCWADMKTRCDNTNNKFYDYYGGRGITYCDKWKTFDGFWEDMKDTYSDDLTLNRRDNDGNYCKNNCYWDTKNFQGHMRRKLVGADFKSVGLAYDQDGAIAAKIKINEQAVYLGRYQTEKQAAKAYDDASQMFYGDRPNRTEFIVDKIYEKVKYYMENLDTDLRKGGEDNPSAKLTREEVLSIVELYKQGIKQKEIANKFGIVQCTVSSICRGASWTSVTGIAKRSKNIDNGEYKVGNNAAEIH